MMKKILIPLLTCLPILFWSAASSPFEVRIIEDRIWVQAEDVPLQGLLQRLSDQGITVRIDPILNPLISADIQGQDIQKGLDSILKPLNHVLIWRAIDGPLGSMTRLDEIHVFRHGQRGLMKPLSPKGVGLVIGTNPLDGSRYVKGEVLLGLLPGMTRSAFMELLHRFGGTIVDCNATTGVYRVRFPERTDIPSLVARITRAPGVAKAEPNYAYPIPTPYQSPDSFVDHSESIATLAEGRSAPIAILDSGLGRFSELEAFILASMDALNPGQPISDTLGHGTQMAYIAAGVITPYGVKEGANPLNPIIPIRAFDDQGMTSNFHIMQGIDFAIQKGARVVSLSWGSETRSRFLENHLNYASSKGLVVIASAGNEPVGEPVYPAAYPSVIGVGALAPDGTTWEKSNHGDFVAMYAPGFASLPVGYQGGPGIYGGTSISAAYVANRIARYLSQNPNASGAEALRAISGQ
jgi:hypothetical protein